MRVMTRDNLSAAFAGESQAHMKYAIFADKAEKEGFPEVARLFRAISYAERVHAENHLRQLGGIADTAENLVGAKSGEDHEVEEMYPAYEAVAELQQEKGALRSIRYALEAEKIHSQMYADAHAAVAGEKDILEAPVRVCEVCGHTVIGDAPEKCPICNVPREKYRTF